jgi:PleD family two-component response regulator
MNDQLIHANDQQLTPRRAVILLDNLFFAAKINQATAQFGVQTIYAKNPEKALELVRAAPTELVIVDLDAANCAPLELIAQLKAAQETKMIPVVGFVSHVNLQVQEAARQAGCDQIMARSAFDRNLSSLFSQLS